ncbi:MAG: hypothetical protein QGI78_07170 [Phycisphaerales bacterium]|jgi:hypothetical protein|nr:hypothetical protein [Phycisphaerales bacterium]
MAQILSTFGGCLLCTAIGFAEVHVVEIEVPTFDRWMYPFNASVGDRESASTFSSVGSGYEQFDDRDGQILMSFATAGIVETDLGMNRYSVIEATIEITLSNENLIFDATSDPWQTYLPEGGEEDTDLGRPIELFGAAFRGGFDGWTFGETGPFPFGAARRERNVYPLSFTDGIGATDASNNVLDQFDPAPFAVGVAQGIDVGQPMPSETVIRFSVEVHEPDIQCYIRDSLNNGLVSFVLTSLHEAQQPGVRGLLQPAFHMKESWLVYYGIADAAQLSLVVDVSESTPEDLNGDGVVNVEDLLIALADWGICTCCQSDIDSDGEVNINDLLGIIAAWG